MLVLVGEKAVIAADAAAVIAAVGNAGDGAAAVGVHCFAGALPAAAAVGGVVLHPMPESAAAPTALNCQSAGGGGCGLSAAGDNSAAVAEAGGAGNGIQTAGSNHCPSIENTHDCIAHCPCCCWGQLGVLIGVKLGL